MERKKTILLGVLLFGCGTFGTLAQETTLSAGGDATGIGSMSYSLGQAFYVTSSGVDASLSEGVQQAYEISSTIGIEEYDVITLNFEVYPNPTNGSLTLDLKDFSPTDLGYVLYDVSGRLIDRQGLSQSKTTIEMTDLPESMYFLKVSNGTSVVKTFKIIKN